MKKIILCVVAWMLSSSVLADSTLKLICDVDITNTYSSGNEEKFRETVQVDIEQIGKMMMVSTDGQNISISISNHKNNPSDQVVDTSDSNKFQIYYATSRDGEQRSREIKIDRNTGNIFYQLNAKMSVKLLGSCKRVDMTKKLF